VISPLRHHEKARSRRSGRAIGRGLHIYATGDAIACPWQDQSIDQTQRQGKRVCNASIQTRLASTPSKTRQSYRNSVQTSNRDAQNPRAPWACRTFVEIEDILQADYRRLVDASQRYSTREGVAFSAYAAIRIRGSIIYFLRCNSNLCRATISMQQKVKQTILVLESEVKRNAEPKEIADRLKVSISG